MSRVTEAGVTVQSKDFPTTATTTDQQKEDEQINRAYRLATDTLRQYRAMLKPRLKQLGKGGEQAFLYANPNWASEKPGHMLYLDPAAQEFFTMLGPMSVEVNKAYSTNRASALGYKTFTQPHIPTPPARGFWSGVESLGTVNFKEYEEQLDKIIQALGRMSGRVPPPNYVELPDDAISLGDGAWGSKKAYKLHQKDPNIPYIFQEPR